MNMVLSVVMKDGILVARHDQAIHRPHQARNEEGQEQSQHGIAAFHCVQSIQEAAHGHHGAYGKVKLASDHQQRDADRDDPGQSRRIDDARYGPQVRKLGTKDEIGQRLPPA